MILPRAKIAKGPFESTQAPIFPHVGVIGLVPDWWGDYWQVRQHVLTRLARYFSVVWVNPGRLMPKGHERPQGPGDSWETMQPKGFYVYTPPFWLPTTRLPGPVSDFFLGRRLRQARNILARQGCRKMITYIWRPEYERALDVLPDNLACYHIDDEYTFSEVEAPTDLVEARLIKRVNQVFIHSQGLFEKKGGLNPRTMVIPNGVDYNGYALPRLEPADLKKIPRPRIGYTGILKTQIDWSLLHELARRRPELSFVFVGPANYSQAGLARSIEALSHLGNVYFLGGKPTRSLPAFVQHFDAAVMPYRINGYTNHIYPLKLHEYLASGCPVVGSKIRSLYKFRDVVSLAGTVDEWSEALSESLSAPACSRQEVEKRRAVAREHDWDRMVHRIALALCNLAEPESAPRLEAFSFGQ